MVFKTIIRTTCACLAVVSFSANAAVLPLESRLGGLAYYDPNLDITWAADAGMVIPDTWDNQIAWVAGLTIGGVSGWRLPSADVNGDNTVIDCTGGGVTGCTDNEMGYMFWERSVNSVFEGVFSNVEQFGYWSSTIYAPDPALGAWVFLFHTGQQGPAGVSHEDLTLSPWAVHSGDVGAIPIPAAVWLFGSGLIGLIGVARRNTRI